ncbi:hypothetical protein [Paraburkholderia sp.]|uniref:hypothetical protein n=1 Tax=Paraburkholderia sp. TaxID=1926495 RepID=UPI0023871153|nr:hypothetical protein [Paraburkholderia sp.]MDE1180890.1 hypothetical protein [Paraburkholderia sp.]
MRTAPNNEKVDSAYPALVWCGCGVARPLQVLPAGGARQATTRVITALRRFKHPKKLPVIAIGRSRPFESAVLGGLHSTICGAACDAIAACLTARGQRLHRDTVASNAADNAATDRNRKVTRLIYAADKNADSAHSTRSDAPDRVFCIELHRKRAWPPEIERSSYQACSQNAKVGGKCDVIKE